MTLYFRDLNSEQQQALISDIQNEIKRSLDKASTNKFKRILKAIKKEDKDVLIGEFYKLSCFEVVV